jgi:mRNA interferase MazF
MAWHVVSRGQIYFVDLNPTRGREQAGRRPVAVVSVNAINRQPLVISVVVGTDASRIARDYPINVQVTSKESGLPKDTTFLCFQLRSLDPSRFVGSRNGGFTPAGHVPPEKMIEIENALRLVLGL